MEDLVVVGEASAQSPAPLQDAIPLVSPAAAMNDVLIPPGAVSELIRLPTVTLSGLPTRQGTRIRQWERFVAVGVTPAQAAPMHPVLLPNMIVVLDRHYNSLAPSREDAMDIFAVRVEKTLLFRYVTFDANRLILRPHGLDHPIRLIEVEPQLSPNHLIIGRVCAYIGQR